MRKDIVHTTAFPLIISSLVSLFPLAGQAQDPGFFLGDWQGKSAVIPGYEPAGKPAGTVSVNIRVDTDQKLNRVPGYIYGNNAVMWGGNMNEHATVMVDINNLDPHVLRWPGGSNSDVYFWNLAASQRPADIPQNMSPWYGVNDDNWQMSTNDYYDLLANTNSTGIIVVNYAYARYGTGPDPVAKAAHMAAEWVRYDKGRSKFWEIGNENFGSWEAGYRIDVSKNQDGQPEYISGRLYGQHCRVFIDSMRTAAAEIGAEIKIGVVAYDAETSWDTIQTPWNEQMMSEVGDVADFLSVHSYFTPYEENSTVSTILNSHHVPKDIMSVLTGDMAEAGKPMIPVAFTEWNIFAVGSMQQVSYINGMHSALVLGEFIRNGYGLATRWDLTNGWSDGDDHGMFSSGGEPGVDYYNPRPVFFYMYYFQQYFGDRMVHSSVSGNTDVIAYASAFSSGETGLVIINKSRSGEIALIETGNLEPGMRYYYHTLTGGTDNGDFSRKVFLNGTGTDEEGGGPDGYETVKAFSGDVEGGIKVSLPALSVVYLMVDREPPPHYVYSKIDTNARVVTVEISDTVILAENPAGFEVIANDTIIHAIAGIRTDPANAFLLYLILDQEILPADEITLSYSGGDVMSPDSVALKAFSDVPVENLLPGAVPRLKDAFTNSDGDRIRLVFNMAVQVAGPPAESMVLRALGEPGRIIAWSDVTVDVEDSSEILITTGEPLYAEYDLVLSYSGTGIRSVHDAPLEPFDSLPVTNHAPGRPPAAISAEVKDFGFSIDVLFDKPLNGLPDFDSLFTVRANNEILPVQNIHISANSISLTLADYIRYGDQVTLDYDGTSITSADRGRLQAFVDLTVQNTLPEPAVFEIPGMVDAELFTVNVGMVLEPCSDSGGGNNLGDIDAGDWLEYVISVTKTGYYKGNLRVASASLTGQMDILTPDADEINQEMVVIRPTGGWQVWKSVPLEIILHEGTQRLRLYALTSNFSVNWLELGFDKTLQAEFVSAATNESGDTIEIIFNRELASPAEGEQYAFSVQADGDTIGVNRLELDKNLKTRLLLVLASGISADDARITVSYQGGTLTATDQTAVAFFNDMPVSNHAATGMPSAQIPGIVVYPNPVSDRLTIESRERTINSVEVLDIAGKRVLYADLKEARHSLHLDLNVAPGVYLLKIRSNDDTFCTKLIAY